MVEVNAQVMTRDESKGGWVPLGRGGVSRVGLVKRRPPLPPPPPPPLCGGGGGGGVTVPPAPSSSAADVGGYPYEYSIHGVLDQSGSYSFIHVHVHVRVAGDGRGGRTCRSKCVY